MNRQDYKTIRSIDEIKEYIGSADIISFDFETSAQEQYREEEYAALDAHKSDITGVSLSVEVGTGRYIPLRHKVGKNADIDTVMAFLTENVFQTKRAVKIAHNMAFEAMFLYKYGVVLQEPVYDTIVAAQLTLKSESEFRDLHDSGLKTIVPYLYGVELPTFEDVTQGKYFDELDPDSWDTCRYACADSDWALALYHTFNEWFAANMPRHRWICEHIESPTAVFTGMMKYNGVGVDSVLMEKKKAEAEDKLVELRERILDVTGDIDIGENCGTQAFNAVLGKTYKPDVLTKYRMKNDGTKAPMYYAENTHPAIIDMETFEMAKAEMKKRREASAKTVGNSRFTSKYPFSGLLVCGECGALLRRHVRTMGAGNKVASWGCSNRVENGRANCDSHHVREDVMHKTYAAAVRQMADNAAEVIEAVREGAQLAMQPENAAALEAVEQEIIELQETALTLHKNKQSGIITQETYTTEIAACSTQMKTLEAQKEKLQNAAMRYAEAKAWLDAFEQALATGEIETTSDVALMRTLVERIIVNDDGIEVEFKCGASVQQQYIK